MMINRNLNSLLIIIVTLLTTLSPGCSRNEGFGNSPDKDLDYYFGSIEELSRSFLAALQEGDLPAMREMAVDREEFERLIWPHIPASRPGSNLTVEFVWRQAQLNSLSGLRETVDRFSLARNIELVRVDLTGEAREYGEVRLLMRPWIVLSVDGHEKRVEMFGAVMLHDSKYKIYSYSL